MRLLTYMTPVARDTDMETLLLCWQRFQPAPEPGSPFETAEELAAIQAAQLSAQFSAATPPDDSGNQ